MHHNPGDTVADLPGAPCHREGELGKELLDKQAGAEDPEDVREIYEGVTH